MATKTPIWVNCTYAAENGKDPLTFARFHGGSYFCNYCGETDHQVVEL